MLNDGQGVRPKEMLTVLRNSLTGSRLSIYELELKEARRTNEHETAPEAVYARIKHRLLMFKETPQQRQYRIAGEWENLVRQRGQSALQWEAEWQKGLANLKEVGLEKGEGQLSMDYLKKVGPVQTDIRKSQ